MQGKRPVGKPRKQWKDAVTDDPRGLLGVHCSRRTAIDEYAWKTSSKPRLQLTRSDVTQKRKKKKK